MAKTTDIASVDELIEEATGVSQLADENVHPVSSFSLFSSRHLAKAGELLPPWWSKKRDTALSSFWKGSSHLSSAVYNSQAKLVGIPLRILAKDPTIPEHRADAIMVTEQLNAWSGFNKTWPVEYAKFIEDLLTQDNGAFMEIIGAGDPDGPIFGPGMGLRHLDSYRCIRTSSPIYPVLYEAEDGKKYKIHWTRIIHMSQMPSPRVEMNGVGFSAVSRSVDITQNLIDISVYKQERLGSRPPNMIIVGRGITGEQIMEAFVAGETESDNRSQSRYSRTVAIGSESPEIGLERVDLSHMEPFDEETSINLGMYAIALAFGMDASELWPTSGGSNKVDSSLKKLRSRGKLPAQTTQELTIQINQKLLPPHLTAVFDLPDDEENQQKALIKDIRARNRERDLNSETITARAARQMALDDGDLSKQMFDFMEMESGRLQDGKPIAMLFFTSDPVLKRHLDFGEVNPVAFIQNDPEVISEMIGKKMESVLKEMAETTSESKSERLVLAHGALIWLADEYRKLAFTYLKYSETDQSPEANEEDEPEVDTGEEEEDRSGPRDGRDDG